MTYAPSTPQMNTWSSDWVRFYAEERLGFQLRLAVDQYGDSTIYEKGELCFWRITLVLVWLTFNNISIITSLNCLIKINEMTF